MHVFDESTNIAANLHCLWLIFHHASREETSHCILGNFFVEKLSKPRMCTPLTSNFQPRILA